MTFKSKQIEKEGT